jgi:putative transposase
MKLGNFITNSINNIMSKNYDPRIHHRRSIRLKGYDYSHAGAYFLTFCCQNREHFFGKIEDDSMLLNDAGTMVNEWWEKIPSKFPDIELGAYITMPNHFHAIVINNGTGNPDVGADPRVCPPANGTTTVGADPRVCPPANGNKDGRGEHMGSPQPTSPQPTNGNGTGDGWGEHAGSPLHRVVQWFKTMSTNAYIRGVKNNDWKRFDRKLWQRNYYEHIIRTEFSYETIDEYILNNPAKWDKDSLK